jgi:hypothetical protein
MNESVPRRGGVRCIDSGFSHFASLAEKRKRWKKDIRLEGPVDTFSSNRLHRTRYVRIEIRLLWHRPPTFLAGPTSANISETGVQNN